MATQDVLIEQRDTILVITINRPDQRNAMTKSASEAISDALDRLDAEFALRCAVITGAGGTFCSGMDLKGFLQGELPIAGERGFGALTSYSPKKPIIAAVDGYALAGGMELALGCDMIVAHKDAKFGIPEAKRGLVAGGGGMVRLPRIIGRPLAMELALTGDLLEARRAYELGLVNRLTEGPALDGALDLAARAAACGPMAVSASKAVIRNSWNWPDDEINEQQNAYIEEVFASQDAREGAMAFAEKRAPVWSGK